MRLPAANELVLIFEGSFVAIVQSDRALAVARLDFEVAWVELPDHSRVRVVVGDAA